MPDDTLIPPTPTAADYAAAGGSPDDAAFFAEAEPFALFARWLTEARAAEPNDPNAMALATVDATGLPDVRMVLLKDVDAAGFTFFTNLESAKGRQLAGAPKAALCFHWKSLRRQVRVRGEIAPVTAPEADAYFATRARLAQLGARASRQSAPLTDRATLEAAVAAEDARFKDSPVERPSHWSGYRLSPLTIEFWRDRPFRLHDRLVFQREDAGASWRRGRLYP